MLTRKAKYGLKALSYLATLDPGRYCMMAEIADARDIPRKFLEAILVELRKHGIVASQKGRLGGYRLAAPAAEISLGRVIRVLDGPLAPFPCASRSNYQPCDDCDEANCEVRRLMIEVRMAICDVLDHRNLAELGATYEMSALIDIGCTD